MKDNAYRWFQLGISVLATHKVTDKGRTKYIPLAEWRKYINEPMTRGQFETQEWNKADGYSLVLGKLSDSKYLILIDFDDHDNAGIWKESDFTDCTSYVEKSPHGYHILMLSDLEVKTIKNYKEVELLSTGHISHMYDSPIKDLPLLLVKDGRITFDEIITKFKIKPKHLDVSSIKNIPTSELLTRSVEFGERNNRCLFMASRLRIEGRTQLDVGLLLTEWNKLNSEPLSSLDLDTIVRSAFKSLRPYYQSLKDGCKFDVIVARGAVFDEVIATEKFACLPSGELYIYQNGVYLAQGIPEQFINEITVKVFNDKYTAYDYQQILGRIKAISPVSEDFFENVPLNLVCLENGILDLNTKELKAFTPHIHFLNKVSTKYDPSATCPLIDKVMTEWLESPKHIQAIYEFLGFCLWREYTYEKAFFFIGEGENGKSTLLNLIIAFLGHKNVSHVPIQALGESFKLATLYGKLANIADELSTNALTDSSKFKELTGRSWIAAFKKFIQYPTNFMSYAKMIYATNQLPTTNDLTYAFFRRPTIFRFNNVFSKENGKRDDQLIDKLTIDSELSGLLNRALEGLKRLQENREFSVEQEISEAQEMWNIDTVHDFATSMLREAPDSKLTAIEIYQPYEVFCKEKGQTPLDTQNFFIRLRKSIKFYRMRIMTKSKRNYVYIGIRLKTNDSDEDIEGFIE